jgi:5'(3')-deoxyribonucleotidase
MERKKRLFFDMDNVLVDFQSGLDKIDEETKNQYRARWSGDKDRLDEIPGLFGKMDPMPGAIEAVRTLAEEYDVFILSTAPWRNPSAWSDKVTWVTKYFDDVFHKRMIITHRKDLVEGDYLIDDLYVFEVGGASKTFKQIKDIPNSYLALDEIEFGTGNIIPLYLFGFLY